MRIQDQNTPVIHVNNWKFRKQGENIQFSRLKTDFNSRKTIEPDLLNSFMRSISLTGHQSILVRRFLKV